MSASSFFSKSAVKMSLWGSAIAGGLVAAMVMFSATPARNPYGVQTDEFGDPIPTVTETNPSTNSAAVIAAAVGGSVVLGVGINAALKQKKAGSSTQLPISQSVTQTRNSGYLYQADRSLRRKLLLLLHEDYQAAERLVQQSSFKHPGKSPNWYLEKVIYDLQRDRGIAG
jgi:hypothetical protein